MKIICVGWNYPLHNKEMNKTLENMEPVIFMKPDTAILRNGKPFFLPGFSDRIEYETELVIRINRLGKNISEKFAPRYYDDVTVGIDFTARDLQQKLREAGEPWEMSKAFDGSAAMGEFVSLESAGGDINNINFSLTINGNEVQKANSSEMINSVNKIIAYVSKYYTLKIGDYIYTGTPSGVGQVKIGDHLEGFLNGKKVLDFFVR